MAANLDSPGENALNKCRVKVPPLFVSFEGIDGCGKSTLMSCLTQWLTDAGIDFIQTREPGGTHLGENIRRLLLDPLYKGMNRRAEVLLYTASRAQLVQEQILPALEAGRWVLSDRFMDATLAYQGYGRGLNLDFLRELQAWATEGLWPHRTILLDCDVDLAWQRMRHRNHQADRMEQEDRSFHERVRRGYLHLARENPARYVVLNASASLDEVLQDFKVRFWEALGRANPPS